MSSQELYFKKWENPLHTSLRFNRYNVVLQAGLLVNMEVDWVKTVLCNTCFPIFIFVYFNFEIAILIVAAHHFPFFSKTEQTLNVTIKTTGYRNYVHRCKQLTLRESSKTCVDEDYPLRGFVEFGLFERFIPIGLYCLMYLLICKKSIHRRVRKHLPWMLLIVLILFLAGDLIQLTAYLVYGIYVGSELNFNHRNWRWAYILGLSKIAVCVILEWTYMLVRTHTAIQKRRKGIAVNTDKLYCWGFSSCCLTDPDNLCEESPNYYLYTYQNVLVHRWLKESSSLQTDKNIADVVKLFTYLHKSQKPKDEEAEIWKTELNILTAEEIGNSNVFNAYQNRKEILAKNQEGIHHNIIPFEKFRKGIKPVDTANWIHQLLPEDAHVRQAVDRNLNEFYLFHYIKREHIPALKENGFEMSNFTSAGAGSAIHFRENSNEHIFFNQGTSKNREYTVVLARVLLGNYSVVTSGQTKMDMYKASIATTFDSTEIEIGSLREFAVKKIEQIYPEYVIAYTKTEVKIT